MKNFVGIIFIVLGLIPLIRYIIQFIIKEIDRKTYFKIMIAASCGVMVFGGIVILFLVNFFS